jgi:hypothetical protein
MEGEELSTPSLGLLVTFRSTRCFLFYCLLMFTFCFLLSCRVLAEEMQGLCHIETGRRKRGTKLYNCLLLLKICPIRESSGKQKSEKYHWNLVINVVRGLCYAATQ